MATTQAPTQPLAFRERAATLRDRLVPPLPTRAALGWIGPLLVAALAAFLRFDRLRVPGEIVFDETYYAKDAYGILRFGAEHAIIPGKTADPMFARGETAGIFTDGGSFVVHPPLGKVLIAGGEWMFGVSPFGWRFAAALVGSLSVLILARTARRMTRSTLLGCVAGLLLALDGLHLVLSRTAILDIFVMFWVVAAFACLVADRDQGRTRLSRALDPPGRSARTRDRFGPWLGVRWWRVGAGVCLGAACATKWNGIYFVAAFALLAVLWDLGARHAAGVRRWVAGGLLLDALPALAMILVVAVLAYLASWTGWFVSDVGWDRGYARSQGITTPVYADLVSLWHYHQAIWDFHTGLDADHPYQSAPWGWLVLARPVAFYYTSPGSGELGCAVDKCSRAVLAIGTPAIWWAALLALAVLAVWWVTRRDWRAGAILLSVAAGWLPWFYFKIADDRTMFLFYAMPIVPFLVLAITLCLGLVIGPVAASPTRRAVGAALVGAYLLLVIANFTYLYPVLSGRVIPYDSWHARMWFSTWI